MVPKEINFINPPIIDLFFEITRLPPQEEHRMPMIVRLITILSKSNIALHEAKMHTAEKVLK